MSDDYRMDRFHQVIQIAMGWTNSHLHEFIFENRRVGMLLGDELDMEDLEDETKLYLKDFNLKEGQAFQYLYDFGDSWEHLIEVESIIDKETEIPQCINGAMSCPPEDCGGIWRYQDLIKTIENSSHPDHAEMLEWVGDDFDSTIFALNTVNAELNHFGDYHNAHPEDMSTPWHQIDGSPEDISSMEDFMRSMLEQ